MCWCAVDKYIVRSLEIEGFLDFGVRCYDEMEDDQGRKKEREEDIWNETLAFLLSRYVCSLLGSKIRKLIVSYLSC